jgi:catecholate siderophore receptor
MPLSSDDVATVQEAATFQLTISSGPLRDVAAAFERATGVRVTIANDSIGDVYSPGVTGLVTVEQGLHAILGGTSFVFRFLSTSSVVLDLAMLSESVSVSAVIPPIASPKYNAPLRDIPQTIEVIPRAAMESQGITTLSEALRNVPGITLQAGEGGGASSTAGDMFNMRGFNASNSLFVDNVRDDGLVSRDVFNLEQVEVFMGPTGSDVGRGTAAGYVNMQTKMPRLPAATSATLAYGTANQRRATLDINRAMPSASDDRWIGKSAVRLNVLWQDSGVAGRDEVENETKAIAPSIALGLSTSSRVTAAAQILRQNNLPDYGIPGAAWRKSLLTPTTVLTSKPVDQSNYYGSPAFDYDHARQNTVTARVEHDLASGWMLSNQTRYNRTDREAVISTVQNVAAYVPETDLVAIARQGNIRENTITSNQTVLAGRLPTGRVEHNITSGFEVIREHQFAPALGNVGTRAPVNIYEPNPDDPVTGFAPARTGAYTAGATTTAAVYGFDSVSLSTRIQVNAGLRFEHYETDFQSVDAGGATSVNESGSDALVSGKAGVVFRVRPTANIYASYGTTVTPPGAANFTLSAAINNQNNPNVKPQRSSNVEVGAKVDFAGGRLSVTGAAFHTINNNVLFSVDAAAVPPVYNQDDKQQVDGVTIGAAGHITPQWQVLGSFGFLDTESLTQNAANNGKRLTLSPKYSGSVWSTYRLPKGWTIGGGVRATDAVFINSANTIVAPGYRIVDALAEYAVNRHLTLRLNVYNLMNEVYIRSVNNNGGRYNPGNPRTAQLTSAITF